MVLSSGPIFPVARLSPFHRPTNQYSGGEAYRDAGPDTDRKGRDYGLDRMPRQTLDSVIHKLLGSVATEFRGAAGRAQALL
jgi:hypothetical protein